MPPSSPRPPGAALEPAAPVMALRGLHKTYRLGRHAVPALRGVDLALRAGEMLALDETQATLLRRDALGFVFQGFNLVPVMTAAENVDYPLLLAGVPAPERRRRVAEVLAQVGLAEHAGHRPDALSGGQRQRVAVARALVKRPALVIADEPTASLDSHSADTVLALMRALCHAQGAAFLIATHDDRLTRRCDRVVRLMDGCIALGAPAQGERSAA